MTATVPTHRPVVRLADVRSGVAVRGSTWIQAALGANWIGGIGNQLVPWIDVPDVPSAGTEYTYAFPCFPSPTSTLRRWLLAFSTPSASSSEEWTVQAGSGPMRNVLVRWQTADRPWQIYEYDEALSSYPTIDVSATLTLVVRRRSGSGTALRAISCIELPRPELPTSAPSLGVDVALAQPGEPIREGAGISDVQKALTLARMSALCRRHLLAASWPVPSPTANAGLAVGGTAVNVFGVPIPVLARPRYIGEATRECRVFVRARAAGGETLQVTATNTKSGGTAVGSTSVGTSFTTYALVPTLAVDVEDASYPDGLAGGTLCPVQIALQRTSGTGTIYVSAVALTEAP